MVVDISIVSGTYNRISYLKQMVQSARNAIQFDDSYGLTHEFVLVDGGSIDGTQRWIEEQPDCRLIQHDGLLGAVKAFNDGAFAAQGQYVILANDDIQFLDNGIYLAWLYMQQHLDCGVGCFYQDRNRQDWSEDTKWHVETMPVVGRTWNEKHKRYDLEQISSYYGQVCIVPKWLGDNVSWWCDENEYRTKSYVSGVKPLHTYAGDNELSSRVYELGFKISPISGAKIHDLEAKDDLRKINNVAGGHDPKAVRGHHPDSWSWGRKWTNGKLCGPVLRDDIVIPNQSTAKERIVYLPIYEPSWTIQKEQKRGLREALARVAFVVEYNYVLRYMQLGHDTMMTELVNLLQDVQPTLVLTQLHNASNINTNDVKILRKVASNAKFVNWNGDYWPDNYFNNENIELVRQFDWQLVITMEAMDKYPSLGVNAAFWQVGWEPDGVGYENGQYNYDVVFLANGYSRYRHNFVREIRNIPNIKFGLYGQGWPDNWPDGQCLYDFKTGCEIYRGSKIALGDAQWPKSGHSGNRFAQAMVAGNVAYAAQWFRGMEENLGMVDGQTCIVWHSIAELKEKINYYLSNESERHRIASNGEKLALERHSFDTRVRELFEILNPRVETEGSWRW